MTGTVALHADPRKWLQRETSVLEFLAPSGLAVSPSRLIAPGPHCHDGLWMTFTEWIPGVGLRELGEDIERLLGQLQPADAQESNAISSLREQLDMLRTTVFESALPTQALHGDVSLRNLLRTPCRVVWNDFEDTFRGPVHWDVASYVGSLRIHGASERSVREVLEAYGWNDEQELAPFLAAQDVYDQIWRMYDRQRRRAWRAAAP
jgi:Ser/Thr protein kinase RdoA (MazF antagonist)